MTSLSNTQTITGYNNNQAGNDVVINNYYAPQSIRFYAEDIRQVILYFSSNIPVISENNLSMNKIDIETKNEINNLSDEYFQYMREKHLLYFTQIRVFLGDPKNEKYLKLYNNTINELQFRIAIIRKNYNCFEEIFNDLLNFMLQDKNIDFVENRNLCIVFLNFMYWNCDIGDKK